MHIASIIQLNLCVSIYACVSVCVCWGIFNATPKNPNDYVIINYQHCYIEKSLVCGVR